MKEKMWQLRTMFKENKLRGVQQLCEQKTSHQTCKLRKCTELKRKSNYTHNELKTVDD